MHPAWDCIRPASTGIWLGLSIERICYLASLMLTQLLCKYACRLLEASTDLCSILGCQDAHNHIIDDDECC